MPGKWFMLALALVAGAGVLSAAETPVLRKVSIEPEMVKAPDVTYRNQNAFTPKLASTNDWLMLKIEFTPENVKVAVPDYRVRKGAATIVFHGWLDQVKVRTTVLFETGIVYRGKPVFGRLTGGTELLSVKRDGHRHLVAMFVPARVLDRYCIQSAAGRPVNRNAFRCEVEISCGGKIIGQAYSNVSGATLEEKKSAFAQLAAGVPRELDLPDMILSRSRSPWAMLAPDNYDLELDKDAGGTRK